MSHKCDQEMVPTPWLTHVLDLCMYSTHAPTHTHSHTLADSSPISVCITAQGVPAAGVQVACSCGLGGDVGDRVAGGTKARTRDPELLGNRRHLNCVLNPPIGLWRTAATVITYSVFNQYQDIRTKFGKFQNRRVNPVI